MKTKTINILINCVSVILHMFSMITSIVIFFLVVYRWNFNRNHRQRASLLPVTSFDNSILLLLIGNTYFLMFFYSGAWLSVLFHTIAGDFAILKDFLYLEDSVGCRFRVAVIFSLTSALFHSFFIQALWCFFKVIFHSRLNRRLPRYFSPTHMPTYLVLILISWFISILIVIPALTVLNVFSYFPEQYHCLISFTNIGGFTYSMLTTYIMPVLGIVYVYSRLVKFIHHTFKVGHALRARRDVAIIRRILIICTILSLSGSPTIVFLFQFILTGRLHPLADRIHELGVAINTNIVTLGFGILNSFIKLLTSRSDIQRIAYRQYKPSTTV